MLEKLWLVPFGSMWALRERCRETRNPALRRLYLRMYEAYQDANGSSIAWNAEFKGIPCFPHGPKSIFVSGDAVIGSNCVIFQQVTIGSNQLEDSTRRGAPRIGDNCYIGAGAKVIGNVVVGHNVRIGANAVVHRDVPDNAVVLAGEQTVVVRDGPPDNRYFSYRGRWVYFDNGRWVPAGERGASAA
ncbi:MAG: serine acetyltransferase [Pseudomonadota bacterium]